MQVLNLTLMVFELAKMVIFHYVEKERFCLIKTNRR